MNSIGGIGINNLHVAMNRKQSEKEIKIRKINELKKEINQLKEVKKIMGSRSIKTKLSGIDTMIFYSLTTKSSREQRLKLLKQKLRKLK